MKRLSIIYPFYKNPRMLARQYGIWTHEWSDALRAQIEIIIVDDASPEPAADVARPVALDGLLKIYRVKEDIPWHQHGARNLGAHVAAGAWLLLTDMDHVIPRDTLAEVLTLRKKDRAYTFGRVDAPADEPGWRADHASTMTKTIGRDGLPKPHVNSFAMTRALFWKVGGYDEDFCGVYGTDKMFRTRLYAVAEVRHLAHAPLIRVSREAIPDASTRDLARKEGRAPGIKKEMLHAKVARGEADVVKVLQFEWERVV